VHRIVTRRVYGREPRSRCHRRLRASQTYPAANDVSPWRGPLGLTSCRPAPLSCSMKFTFCAPSPRFLVCLIPTRQPRRRRNATGLVGVGVSINPAVSRQDAFHQEDACADEGEPGSRHLPVLRCQLDLRLAQWTPMTRSSALCASRPLAVRSTVVSEPWQGLRPKTQPPPRHAAGYGGVFRL
jgi:hypothetical protein